jgi:hypothetical protein
MNNAIKTVFKKYGMFAVSFLIADLFLMSTAFSQTVVVNPTSPWTVPAGVTSIKVEVWGAGGGGGAAWYGYGGGGGGGAYNVATFTVTPGHTFNITIGTGGSAGSFSDGGTGGATTVSGVDGTVSADGGGGGGFGAFYSNGGNGLAGSSATGAHNGGAGGTANGNGAGGGGGAGNNANGTDGSNTSNGSGGAGNPNLAPYIGGDGGAARTTNGTGNNAGTGPGGGGGGGRNTGGLNNGGSGADGQVVITYYACSTITASATYTNVLCNGTNTGQIIVSGSGGATPYTFSINNGASYQSSNTFNNLPTGTYQIRVKDNNGCESKAVQ